MARGAKLARRARRRSAARTAKRLPGRPRTPELPSFPFAPPRTTGPLWGRDEDGAKGLAVEVLCLPSPDWLKHRLTISGPEAELALFQAAAAGPGVIPWQSNVADLAEGWFNCMMAVPVPERGISVAGAHQLAGRLRDAVESRLVAAFEHRRALACPLDLHALIPVPPALLGRGPVDPLAIAWLWAHWGTTWPLRHVTARPGPRARAGGTSATSYPLPRRGLVTLAGAARHPCPLARAPLHPPARLRGAARARLSVTAGRAGSHVAGVMQPAIAAIPPLIVPAALPVQAACAGSMACDGAAPSPPDAG